MAYSTFPTEGVRANFVFDALNNVTGLRMPGTKDVNGIDVAGALIEFPRVLGKSAVAVSCPVDTTEDILATINVPANAMGPNGHIRITTLWSYTNGAGTKTPRVRFGGIAGTIYDAANGLTTSASGQEVTIIQNRGVTNSQVGVTMAMLSTGANNNSAKATSAIDTAVAQTIVLTGQKNTGGDTLTLESYLVELIYGA